MSPKTPVHTVRVPAEIWQAAHIRAQENGETVSDVVRRCLTRYAEASR